MIIEAMRVRNYKVLRDVHLTKMPRMAVFVGANGSGKSTLLDVFAFLQECVQFSIEQAMSWRGGVDEVFTREKDANLELALDFRLGPRQPKLRYELVLQKFEDIAIVVHESLIQTGRASKPAATFFSFSFGIGTANPDSGEPPVRKDQNENRYDFDLLDTLGLAFLGKLKQYTTIGKVRQAIGEWHCTSPVGRGARDIPRRHQSNSLNLAASNIKAVGHHLSEEHPKLYGDIVRKMRKRVPGLKGIEPIETEDGSLDLRFYDEAFRDSLSFESASVGTRKLYAIYLMLHEPDPHSLLTYEEPENDLYPKVMGPLAEEFRAYADEGSQVLVSTHSPNFVNALHLDEVYWMEKKDGFARVVRAKDDPNVVSQNAGGELLGTLWGEGFFGRAHPR